MHPHPSTPDNDGTRHAVKQLMPDTEDRAHPERLRTVNAMFVFRPGIVATMVSLCAMWLLLAPAASAQGFYYKEVEKDGRI